MVKTILMLRVAIRFQQQVDVALPFIQGKICWTLVSGKGGYLIGH